MAVIYNPNIQRLWPGRFLQPNPASNHFYDVVGPIINPITNPLEHEAQLRDLRNHHRNNVLPLDLPTQLFISDRYGSDANNGLTYLTPWKTAAPLNAWATQNKTASVDLNVWPGDEYHFNSARLAISSLTGTTAGTAVVANLTTFCLTGGQVANVVGNSSDQHARFVGGASANSYDHIKITGVSGTTITWVVGAAGITVASDRAFLQVSPITWSETQGDTRVRRWENRLGIPAQAVTDGVNPDNLKQAICSQYGVGNTQGQTQDKFLRVATVAKMTSAINGYTPRQGVLSGAVSVGGSGYGANAIVPLQFSAGGATGFAKANSSGVLATVVITKAGIHDATPTVTVGGTGTLGVVTLTMDGGNVYKIAAASWQGWTGTAAGTLAQTGFISSFRAVNSLEDPWWPMTTFQDVDEMPGSFWFNSADGFIYFNLGSNTLSSTSGADVGWEWTNWNSLSLCTWCNPASHQYWVGVQVHGYGCASPNDLTISGYGITFNVGTDKISAVLDTVILNAGRHITTGGGNHVSGGGIGFYENVQHGGTIGDAGNIVTYQQLGGHEHYDNGCYALFGRPGFGRNNPYGFSNNAGRGAAGSGIFAHGGGCTTQTNWTFPGGASGNTIRYNDGNSVANCYAPTGMPISFPGTVTFNIISSATYSSSTGLTGTLVNGGSGGSTIPLTITLTGGTTGTISGLSYAGGNLFPENPDVVIAGGTISSGTNNITATTDGELRTVLSNVISGNNFTITLDQNLNGTTHPIVDALDRPIAMFHSSNATNRPGQWQVSTYPGPSGNIKYWTNMDPINCCCYVMWPVFKTRKPTAIDQINPNLANKDGSANASANGLITPGSSVLTIIYGGDIERDFAFTALVNADVALGSTETGGWFINTRFYEKFTAVDNRFQNKRTSLNTTANVGTPTAGGAAGVGSGYKLYTRYYACSFEYDVPHGVGIVGLYKNGPVVGSNATPNTVLAACVMTAANAEGGPTTSGVGKLLLSPRLGNRTQNQWDNCYVKPNMTEFATANGWSNELNASISNKQLIIGKPNWDSPLLSPVPLQLVAGLYRNNFDKNGTFRSGEYKGPLHPVY